MYLINCLCVKWSDNASAMTLPDSGIASDAQLQRRERMDTAIGGLASK